MHSNESLHLWRRIDNSCFWSASEAKVRGDFQGQWKHNSNHKPAAFLFFSLLLLLLMQAPITIPNHQITNSVSILSTSPLLFCCHCAVSTVYLVIIYIKLCCNLAQKVQKTESGPRSKIMWYLDTSCFVEIVIKANELSMWTRVLKDT